MEEDKTTELKVVETQEMTKWQKTKKFVGEHMDATVSVIVAGLGFLGTILGIVSMMNDHKMKKEEQEADLEMHYYEHGWIWDSENNVNWFAELSNDEKKELIEREKNGESRFEILKDMDKI